MAKFSNNKGVFLWVGGLAFLALGALFLMPKITGKGGKITKGKGGPPVGPAVAAALKKPGYVDYGVANSLYGNIPSHNFAGMAVEMPSQTMPLGFHLSNVF